MAGIRESISFSIEFDIRLLNRDIPVLLLKSQPVNCAPGVGPKIEACPVVRVSEHVRRRRLRVPAIKGQ